MATGSRPAQMAQRASRFGSDVNDMLRFGVGVRIFWTLGEIFKGMERVAEGKKGDGKMNHH